MVFNGSKQLLCLILLFSSIAFSIHRVDAASGYSSFAKAEQLNLAYSFVELDENSSSDYQADKNDHCLTHVVLIAPTSPKKAVIASSHAEIVMSVTSPFLENYYKILRPPKVTS